MKKIVELLIKKQDLELEELGVDVVSLVENPAIGYEWFAFEKDVELYVDNEGFENYKKFLDDNVDLFKKPGGGAAGEGAVDHGEQMKVLEEKGIDTGYPFGYCFQIAQFVFYMLGGYESQYSLKCIKGMEYKVDGIDFKSTHWYVQHENGRIIDLSAEQFDGILDINDYYVDGRNANLGFPYYNVDGDRVEFETTVPSLQTLKLYKAWKESHEKNEFLEKFYKAAKYEELRATFTAEDFFVHEDFCTDCFDLDDACWPGYEAIGMKTKNGKEVPNCVPVNNSVTFESIDDYPQYIKDAAKRGISLNEAIGNQCATQTGKVRAQQLAQGKPISEDTVRRMYSYLSRAEVYYDPSDTTSCGTISYLLWGGPEALEWSKRKVESMDQQFAQDAILAEAEKLGEEIDEKLTTYLSEEGFAEETTVGAVADAVKALDILSKRDAEEESKVVYKYEGPIQSNSRKFCRAMVGLSRTKVFSAEDIDRMSVAAVNGGAVNRAGATASSYDVFKYAGGSNCNHRWIEYKMFKAAGGRTLLIRTGVETTIGKDSFTKVVEEAVTKVKQNFQTIDEDQRIVVAPAMVPKVMIKRRNELGQEYYVYFSENTIKDIAEKFFAKNYQNNTDIDHDGNIVQTNTLLESWIVEDTTKDKSSIYGFEVPKGTWMLSMRINDEDTWKKIKSGELKGYSISGNFIEEAI